MSVLFWGYIIIGVVPFFTSSKLRGVEWMAQQVNGLPTWETWSQNMTEEQRRYEMFRLLYSISCRVDKLERRPMWDKALAFTGGLIGGFAAVVAYFLSKNVGA